MDVQPEVMVTSTRFMMLVVLQNKPGAVSTASHSFVCPLRDREVCTTAKKGRSYVSHINLRSTHVHRLAVPWTLWFGVIHHQACHAGIEVL
eukprot:1442458-Pyramimonas_sp.AAC.1